MTKYIDFKLCSIIQLLAKLTLYIFPYVIGDVYFDVYK